MPIKIALTGGPCAGKTTILKRLNQDLGQQILTVPETASILLMGGFPHRLTLTLPAGSVLFRQRCWPYSKTWKLNTWRAPII